MSKYETGNITTVALLGHAGAGKTSLLEAAVYATKGSERLGKVIDGTTMSDYDPEEVKRKSSLQAAVVPVVYQSTKINFIDAPGLDDFALGQFEALSASENVVVAVSGRSSVSVGTKKAYHNAKKQGKPVAFFVTKLDTETADFYKVFEDLKANFGPSVFPVVVPFGEDGKGYIDLLEMQAYEYDNLGGKQKVEMPDMGHRIEGLIAAISEAVAETDEDLFEKYFSGEAFTKPELIKGIQRGMQDGTISPVFCGCSYTLAAVDLFLDGIATLMPKADQTPPRLLIDQNGDPVEVICNKKQPFIGLIFKTVADPFMGKLSYVKLLAGQLHTDDIINAPSLESPTKAGKIYYPKGKALVETTDVVAGDICVLAKVDMVKTGDILSDKKQSLRLEEFKFPSPNLSMAITAAKQGDEGKISTALSRLLEEDKTLTWTINSETTQQVLSGLGESHLEVTLTKLKTKFGVEANLDTPKVPYRETLTKQVKVEGKYKKQTGGHGQYGHVVMEFAPCDEDFIFEEKVFGGSVPRNYFPAVEKGLMESMPRGYLKGYPITGVKATLLDGSYHPVDSSEFAFKTAASMALRNAMEQGGAVLLEPVCSLSALIPEEFTGDFMGEINKRRGKVLGITPEEGGFSRIEGELPMVETLDLSTAVRAITQGQGEFGVELIRYDRLPENMYDKIESLR